MKRAITLWLVVTAVSLRTTAVLYNKTSSNLNKFPDDIPLDVGTVILTDNLITAVETVPVFPRLANLTMARNSLTGFPDLVNVSATLTYLDLSSNLIDFIQPDLLDQMRSLGVLRLGGNPLTSIPDVAGPSSTLYHLGLGYTDLLEFPLLAKLGKNIWTLFVHGTRIESVPTEIFDYFPNLAYVLLYGTRIRQLPNLCHSRSNPGMSIDVSRMQLDCNLNFIWLKIAVASNHIQLAGVKPSCITPEGDLVSWYDANINTVTDSGTGEAYYTGLLNQTNFYCPLEVEVKVAVSCRMCALHCLKKADCALFAVDGGECVLTSLKPSQDSAIFSSYNKWFVLLGK